MPLPKEPLVLTGGCNCRSIRYRVSVPPEADRPIAPYHKPGTTTDTVSDLPRIPVVLLDHCNDCRRATASVVPMCLVTDASKVELSVLPKDYLKNSHATSDEARAWQPLASVTDSFENENVSSTESNTTLGHYISSANRNRWFCTHCGTPLGYSVNASAYPESWKSSKVPRMFDFWLGTLDREWLEQEWMRPDHAVWCHFGVDWVSDLVKNGARRLVGEGEDGSGHGKGSETDDVREVKTEPLPRHPLFMVDQQEGEDVHEWLMALGK
ncbi:hypothetical protein H2200_010903 [Cladophialophora chaetospira]|uniref:CENP-V/GFA domain-containing protein n=1 Tax=Cladophialophora chaetospira TaxID=386627 RepID=A0AA38X0Y3_9EURO|nr:hypothetical protein H2200_010903 [Cladophialophora chaetospira]